MVATPLIGLITDISTNWISNLFAAVFGTVFLAEIADKTQLVTLLYASNAATGRLAVFLGSAAALVLASAINVWAGSVLNPLDEP